VSYIHPLFTYRYPTCPLCHCIIHDTESVMIWCKPGRLDAQEESPAFEWEDKPYHIECAMQKCDTLNGTVKYLGENA
jgi:hypothetical protein